MKRRPGCGLEGAAVLVVRVNGGEGGWARCLEAAWRVKEERVALSCAVVERVEVGLHAGGGGVAVGGRPIQPAAAMWGTVSITAEAVRGRR